MGKIEITEDLRNKLNKVFPDSNITHSYKNCCDYYKITW